MTITQLNWCASVRFAVVLCIHVVFIYFVVENSARSSHPQKRIYCRDQHDKKRKKKNTYIQKQAERKWSLKFLPIWVDSSFTQVQSRTLLTANITHFAHTNIRSACSTHTDTRVCEQMNHWTECLVGFFGQKLWETRFSSVLCILVDWQNMYCIEQRSYWWKWKQNQSDAFNDCHKRCVMSASSYVRYPKMENDKSNCATAAVSEDYDKSASETYSARLQNISSEK